MSLCCSRHVGVVKRFALICLSHFGVQRLRWATHALTPNSYELQILFAQLIVNTWKELMLISFLGIQKWLDSATKLVAVDHAYS